MVRIYDVPGHTPAQSRATYVSKLQLATQRFEGMVAVKLKGVVMGDIMRILELRAQVEEAPEAKKLDVIEKAITEISAMSVVVPSR